MVSAKAGRVVLVGGGDPYLSRDQLTGLAASTAEALKGRGERSVRVGYDASLFTGPARSPTWPSGYATSASSVSALWADRGRVTGHSTGPRFADPAKDAADRFAAALRTAGVRVRSVTSTRAPEEAAPLASVVSQPLRLTVETMLRISDNDTAEVLFRQVGLARRDDGSFTGGRRAVHDELGRLGVWQDSTRIYDGSGLSRQTRVSPTQLVEVVRLGLTEDRPAMRSLLTGLPVAGVDGSLQARFRDDRSEVGRGLVRAKTGTLRGVYALAGYSRTADGSMLVFAFLGQRRLQRGGGVGLSGPGDGRRGGLRVPLTGEPS